MDLRSYDADRIHLSRLGLDDVRATARRLEADAARRARRPRPMHPGRVDVIGGGSLVMRVLAEELAERADVTELVVSEHDILDGMARGAGGPVGDTPGRPDPPDAAGTGARTVGRLPLAALVLARRVRALVAATLVHTTALAALAWWSRATG